MHTKRWLSFMVVLATFGVLADGSQEQRGGACPGVGHERDQLGGVDRVLGHTHPSLGTS